MNDARIVILPCEDIETGKFRLMATNYGRTSIAGERLFRGQPYPNVSFEHDNQESAKRDAEILQEYLDASFKSKISRNKIRKAGA